MTKRLALGTLVLAACTAAEPPPIFQPGPPARGAAVAAQVAAPEPSPEAKREEALDERFVPMMAAAFRDYIRWGRWDDELRWAPWMCAMPEPGKARFSEAEHGGHARKLYSVFAKEHETYGYRTGLEHSRQVQPVGQTLVKEAYHPEKVDKVALEDATGPIPRPGPGDHFDRYVLDGEQLYRASELAGIYVLTKLAPNTPGTDEGWVYGTVAADGTVTSAGRVGSCMGCHEVSTTDRVLGM